MAVESIVCPHCGSGDVTEVKLNTYFCNHCETISKYFDPSKTTVVSSPAFCTCGNKVEFQCNLCAKGLCALCDVIATHERAEQSWKIRSTESRAWPHWAVAPLIESKDWGYNFQLPAMTAATHLPCMKVVNSVENSLGHPNHICMTCVSDAVPRLRKILEAGGVCTIPACPSGTSYNCDCCGYGFCGVHLGNWRKTGDLIILKFWDGIDTDRRITFFPDVETSTMCRLCILEKGQILYDFALDTFDVDPSGDISNLKWQKSGFLHFKKSEVRRTQYNYASVKYARQRQSEFQTKMREIEPTLREQIRAVRDAPCRMNEHFESGKRLWRIVGIDPPDHPNLEVL